MRRRTSWAWGFALACVVSAADVRAEEPTPPSPEAVDTASRHFERGVRLFEEGDPKLALVEFERSYAAVPDPRTLYNIGQVQLKLGAFAEARATLERYLSELGDRVPPQRRETVKQNLEALALRTAYVTIRVNEPDSEVRLDGALLGKSPLARTLVSSGLHTIAVTKVGFEAEQKDVSLVGGDDRVIDLALRKVVVRDTNDSARAPNVTTHPVFWIAWGTTAALAATTVGTGLAWQSSASDLDAAKQRVTTRQELDDKKSSVETRMTLAAAFGTATLVAAGVSAYLTFKLSSPRRASTVAVGPFGAWGTF